MSAGLDQLCLAACEPGLSEPINEAAEIKVVELDAYASVADLIQAAISARLGAATLKEIYEVCENHGRIAYRRAGGSRIITTNEHWKSQIRHALYTGQRFRRVPNDTDYWQLTQAESARKAELIKVLVRTDDPTCNIYAVSTLPEGIPAAAAEASNQQEQQQPAKPKESARRRGKSQQLEGASDEGMCDTAELLEAAPSKANGKKATKNVPVDRRRVRLDFDPSDNHSTQESEDEGEDDMLPSLRPSRLIKRPDHPAAVAHRAMMRKKMSGSVIASGNSDEPTTLRWGSTGLRSSVIVADDSSFSVGRGTPKANANRILLNNRDKRKMQADWEADSPPLNNNQGNKAPPAAGAMGPPPTKRRARDLRVKTPIVTNEATAAHVTPATGLTEEMAASEALKSSVEISIATRK